MHNQQYVFRFSNIRNQTTLFRKLDFKHLREQFNFNTQKTKTKYAYYAPKCNFDAISALSLSLITFYPFGFGILTHWVDILNV